MVQSLLPVKKGFFVVRFFRFSDHGRKDPRNHAGRQSVSPGGAALDTNNKEVPLDARKSDPEMQRVQAEKLQYHEEQEEYPRQA
jgi:hypothetical protein